MSRRAGIALSQEELDRLLMDETVVVVATTGRDGRPHLTALWYVVRDGRPWIFTYAKSQKVRNLERNPEATLLIETGDEYHELRGAMIYADAVIHRDVGLVADIAEELFVRYSTRGEQGRSGLDERTREASRSRAAKRVAVEFRPTRIVSWDHTKLGGTY